MAGEYRARAFRRWGPFQAPDALASRITLRMSFRCAARTADLISPCARIPAAVRYKAHRRLIPVDQDYVGYFHRRTGIFSSMINDFMRSRLLVRCAVAAALAAAGSSAVAQEQQEAEE